MLTHVQGTCESLQLHFSFSIGLSLKSPMLGENQLAFLSYMDELYFNVKVTCINLLYSSRLMLSFNAWGHW